jgi:isoleucyl-tRNA synthetase
LHSGERRTGASDARFALDAEGRKMSKSLGNVVAPEKSSKKRVSTSSGHLFLLLAPWDDLKFNWEGVKT